MCKKTPGTGGYDLVSTSDGMVFKSASTGNLYDTPPCLSYSILTDFRILEQLDICGLEKICEYTGLTAASAESIWLKPAKKMGGNIDDRIYTKLIELRNVIYSKLGTRTVNKLRLKYDSRKNMYGFQKSKKTKLFLKRSKYERKVLTTHGQKQSFNRPNNNHSRIVLTVKEQLTLIQKINKIGMAKLARDVGYSRSALRKIKLAYLGGDSDRPLDAIKGARLKEYLNS